MGLINWIKIQFLRYERHHARYMQAFLISELHHSGAQKYSFQWCLFDEQITDWAATEMLASVKIRALQIRSKK